MRILSAEMANIPKASIKKLLKSYFDVKITDEAAEEMAGILDKKAREISEYAVENAKKESRRTVTKKDIAGYIVSGEDEQ